MNVVGIIAEYNPMHNGHIYHIKKARELTNADYVIVIMSGSFTEQGNISVIDKMNKVQIAIENGADMVIELPTIYALSSAERFAYGAVNILNSLGVVTHLAFGAEAKELYELEKIATTYINNKEQIITKVKASSSLGITSVQAYTEALKNILKTDTDATTYTLPNNVLAVEYIKALFALKSQIKPVLVQRLKTNHNEQELSNLSQYASSTSIRNVLANNDLNLSQKLCQIKNVIPENTYNILKSNSFHTNAELWNTLKYEIIKLNAVGLKDIQEVAEGLENKLYKCAFSCNSYDEYIQAVKSKRYTLSKIKRICAYILLGITKDKYTRLSNVNYARVLKVKKESLELLSHISKNTKNTVITKVTDSILNNLDQYVSESIELDILANNLFFTPNVDYTNKIIQP